MPFATPGDLTAGGRICVTARSLSVEGAASARSVPAGSTLFVCIGSTIGKIAQAGCQLTTNQQINAAVPKEGIDPDWLYAVLASKSDHVSRIAGRQAVPIVPKSEFEKLRLLVPPQREQIKIGKVCREWDRATAATDALLAAKQQCLAWVRSRVLSGKVRLPGFDAPWPSRKLSLLLHEHGGRSTGSELVYSVSVRRGLVNQIEHLGRSFAAAETSHYNRVKPGDIVYTKSPTGDFPLGIIKQSKVDREVIVSPLYGVFTPRSRELGILLDAYFSSPKAAERYLTPLVQKGAKNTIAVTNTQFLQGTVTLPDDAAEIENLAALVDLCAKEISQLEDLAAALREQKRGLMQKLLIGEWPAAASAVKAAAA